MVKITSRDSENLIFYHFLASFFFPVFFIIRIFAAINLLVYDRSNLNACIIAVALVYFSGATAFCLKRFKPLSIHWMTVSNILMTVNILFPISSAIKAKAPIEEYAPNLILLAIRIAFTVFCLIYMLRRKSLFVSDFEAKEMMEEALKEVEEEPEEVSEVISLKEEPPVKKKKNIGKYILWPVLTVLGYSLISDWGSNLTNELYYFLPPLQKLLDFPFPTEAPLENAYSTLCILIYASLAFMSCFTLKKAGVFTLEDLSLSKEKKKLLPFILATVAGIILVVFIALFQMKVYGSALKPNKLFPRVIYAISCGGLYYMGVGMAEEILFRGMLLNLFVKKKKIILGVLISNLCFVGLHFLTGVYDEWRAFVFLFFLGLLLSMIFIYTNNLWICMGVHYGYDWAVTHLIEMRFIANKNSFFFLTKLYKWPLTISISAVSFFFTVVLFVLYLLKQKKAKEA